MEQLFVPLDATTSDSIESRTKLISYLFIILLIGNAMFSFAWVGYVGSDDHSYARGALGWLAHFPHPYVGDDHWTLRHPVVGPIAVSLALFGLREISLGLPSALFFLLFLVTNYFYGEYGEYGCHPLAGRSSRHKDSRGEEFVFLSPLNQLVSV